MSDNLGIINICKWNKKKYKKFENIKIIEFEDFFPFFVKNK